MQPVTLATPPKPVAISFSEDPKPLPRYRSKRFALSLPLPDGRAWRIDDHSRPELVATHEPTRSRIAVSIFRAEELVGRKQCEALARERKIVPGELRTVEDVVAITQETFDTRIRVGIELRDERAGPGRPIVGHVVAVGGFLRKCYAFDFSTEIDGAGDEPVLSARLAFARARILGGFRLDPFGEVPRERPPAD